MTIFRPEKMREKGAGTHSWLEEAVQITHGSAVMVLLMMTSLVLPHGECADDVIVKSTFRWTCLLRLTRIRLAPKSHRRQTVAWIQPVVCRNAVPTILPRCHAF